jgi:8-oxo-dGTP pyrophosphatase MutT (NUDIX family)
MAPPRPWQVIETRLLEDCRVFRVRRSLARSPRTARLHPLFGIDADDWVNVVPLTRDGQLVMVRQYRHGSGTVTLEVPGGAVDAGETPLEAARRELLEETGYHSERFEPIGAANPNPALFGNRLHTFLARDAEPVAPVRNGEHEETVVELVPRGEIQQRVRQGRIDHALVLAALHWLALAEAASGR